MQAKRVVAAVVATAALLAAIWLLLARNDVPIAPTPANAADTAPAAAPAATVEAAAPAAPEQPVSAAATAAPATERSEVALADPRLAVLRGRCVDTSGRPLAGCTVHLHGWEANEERVEQWLLEHGAKPEWERLPDVTTADDGRFRFSFWPPPPFQFFIDISLDRHGVMSGRWFGLKEGSETDVGDVVLEPGVRVSGRIVDQSGAPQDKECVTFSRQDRRNEVEGAVRANWGSQASSEAGGTFALRRWLAPGTYELRAQEFELVSPKTVTLTAERLEEVVTVVVKAPAPLATIRGRVFDEAGAPAPDVQIEDHGEGGWSTASTDHNGRFELRRRGEPQAGKARLHVYSTEYEVDADEVYEVAWGTSDVELHVARAGTLTLRVTDSAEAPIGDYTVRLLPRNRNRWSSLDSRARSQGKHPDGTATIAGLTRGDWLLIVDFPSASGLQPLFEPFRQEVLGPRRMDLRAEALAVRVLRIVDAAEAPVAGSKVQLCELFGKPLDERRMVMRRETWLMNSGNEYALVLFEGESGADGRLELRGPPGRELGLCLLGPGHMPLRQAGVRIDVEDELVVRVGRGARLTGKVVPPEALGELKRLVDVGVTQAFPGSYRPQLQLAGAGGARFPSSRVAAMDLERLFLADDGSFDVDGLPPGTWQLHLSAWISNGHGGTSHRFDGGTIVLVDGQTLHRDLDLQAVLPGTVEGTVLLNGVPLANAQVTLHDAKDWKSLQTDASGRFTCSCFPGDYEFLVNRRNSGDSWSELRSPDRVRVVRGEVARQTFTVASGRLQVVLRDAAGKPVAGVGISLMCGERGSLLRTDADGRCEGEFPPEQVVLRILPKQYSTPEALQKLRTQAPPGSGDPIAPLWIPLATVTVAAGQAQNVELKLPADSGY